MEGLGLGPIAEYTIASIIVVVTVAVTLYWNRHIKAVKEEYEKEREQDAGMYKNIIEDRDKRIAALEEEVKSLRAK